MSDPRSVDRPATFREVLSSGEFRALYAGTALSWVGDALAKAAVTALIFQRTDSAAMSAAAFAISFLPWICGGPVLAALAERYPYRRVMIICDVGRMALVAGMAIPGMPVPAMIGLLFLAALLHPPFDAARSALIPRIVAGDRYVVAIALTNTTSQIAQILGYVSGALLATYQPRLALLVDAATFGLSALLIAAYVLHRKPVGTAAPRKHLLRETAEGIGLVFGRPVLRAIAILVFTLMLFTMVPEGLAAAWAAELTPVGEGRGITQGLIMISLPIGNALGLVYNRLAPPMVRQRMIRPFAVLAPLALVPAVFEPPIWLLLLMGVAAGFCVAGLFPAANGMFVQALPNTHRARAFGVMATGVQVLQAVGVLIAGWLATRFDVPTVVGVWSLVGAGLLLLAGWRWPSAEYIAGEIARVKALNAATDAEDRAAEQARRAATAPEAGAGAEPSAHRADRAEQPATGASSVNTGGGHHPEPAAGSVA